MHLKYRNYRHDDNTAIPASFTKEIIRSPRGYRMFQRWTMVVTGTLIADSQSAIKSAIQWASR